MHTLRDVPANRVFLILDFPAGVNKVFMYKTRPPKEGKKNKRPLYEVVKRVKRSGRYETRLFRGTVAPFSAAFVLLVPTVFR